MERWHAPLYVLPLDIAKSAYAQARKRGVFRLGDKHTLRACHVGLPPGTKTRHVFCQEVGGNQPHHGGNNLSQHFGNKYTPTAT